MSTVNTEVREQQKVSGADQSYLLDALKKIILIRTVEQFAQDFSLATPPKYLGSAHFCAGQEAVPVGTIAGLATCRSNRRNISRAWLGLCLRTPLIDRGIRRNLPAQRRRQRWPRRLRLHDGPVGALHR